MGKPSCLLLGRASGYQMVSLFWSSSLAYIMEREYLPVREYGSGTQSQLEGVQVLSENSTQLHWPWHT